jgi:hypothetical protein
MAMVQKQTWRRAVRLAVVGVLTLLVLAASVPAQVSSAQSDERCFAETGYCISGRIREFWEQNGGLPVFGLPIGPQQEQTIEGQALQVQWFERNRLELHPENERPYDVLLGRLGVDTLEQQGRNWRDFDQAAGPQDDCLYFEQTGHNVCGELLTAWRTEGIDLNLDGISGNSDAESLALFGLPISGEITETLSDGNEYTVQYFERARFERHPENEPPYNVLLGLLGNELLAEMPNLVPVRIGELTRYTYPGGLFALDVPTGWLRIGRSSEQQVSMAFADSTRNGGVLVVVREVARPLADPGDYLQRVLTNTATQIAARNLTMEEPVAQPDGSVRIAFTYQVPVQGQSATIQGNSMLRQDADYVSFVAVVIPQRQYAELTSSVEAIIRSYTVASSVTLP